MAPDEEDLYDEEFDFVDDDDDDDDDDNDEEVDEESGDEQEVDEAADKQKDHEPKDNQQKDKGNEEEVDEYGRPEPAANFVVHVYEFNKFKRTIDRPFTPEDAEAFATEYNRTAQPYGRMAVAGKNDVKPKKSISARATNPD
jgi:hypothetical protein